MKLRIRVSNALPDVFGCFSGFQLPSVSLTRLLNEKLRREPLRIRLKPLLSFKVNESTREYLGIAASFLRYMSFYDDANEHRRTWRPREKLRK